MFSVLRILFVVSGTIAILSFGFLCWEDFSFSESALQYVDYRNSFYIAGLLVRQGMTGDLYPAASDTKFHDTKFNKFAHEALPSLSKYEACNFLYPPVVAFFFAPLTLFNARLSTFIWQLVSLAALCLSALLLRRLPQFKSSSDELFFLCFLFFPLLHVLMIGQLAIVFGLLPLTLGYVLLKKRKLLLSGIVWSCLTVKLQFFMPLMAIAIAGCALVLSNLFKKRPNENKWQYVLKCSRLASGFFIGVFLLHVLPLIFAGTYLFSGWLKAVNLVNQSMFAVGQSWAQHTIMSLPAALAFLFPISPDASQHIVSGTTIFFWTALVTVLFLWMRKQSDSGQAWLDHGLLLAYIFLPLISPYIRFYDCTILILPAWIYFFSASHRNHNLLNTYCRLALISICSSLNLFWLLLWILGKHPPQYLIFLPLLVVLGFCILLSYELLRSKEISIEES